MQASEYLSPLRPPAVAPGSGWIVAHQAWREARDQVLAAVRAGGGLVLLSGPAGTGKTLLLQDLARTLRAAGFDALLQSRGDIPIDLDQVDGAGEARPRVVLIDEADRMDRAALEHLARLGARSLVLAGLTGAERWPGGLPVAAVRLAPLRRDEVGAFVTARLAQAGQPADRFDRQVVARLAERSGGVPRVLDMLIGAVLFLAGTDRVEAEHVDEAAALRGGGAGADAPAAEPSREASAAPLNADPASRSVERAGTGAPARYRAAALGAAAGVVALCGWLVLWPGGSARQLPPVAAEWSSVPSGPTGPGLERRAGAELAEPTPAAPEQHGPTPAAPSQATSIETLPSGAPARVVLHYARGEADAASRAARLALALRGTGLSVSGPVAVASRGKPGVRYFFAEDRDTADAVLRSAKLSGQSVLASAAGRGAPPRPGTIEVVVAAD